MYNNSTKWVFFACKIGVFFMYNIYTIIYSLQKHYRLNVWQFYCTTQFINYHQTTHWDRWVLRHISTLNRKCIYYLYISSFSSSLAWSRGPVGSTLTPPILGWRAPWHRRAALVTLMRSDEEKKAPRAPREARLETRTVESKKTRRLRLDSPSWGRFESFRYGTLN